MAKKETTLTVADMKRAIWEKEGWARLRFDREATGGEPAWIVCVDKPETEIVDIATGFNPDEAWRNAYDALFGGKK